MERNVGLTFGILFCLVAGAAAQAFELDDARDHCLASDRVCLEALDTNNDGALAIDELDAYAAEGQAGTVIGSEFMQQFDADKNGLIDLNEIPSDFDSEIDPVGSASASSL